MYRRSPSYLSLTWGYPRWWYPFGYGPYGYGSYGYYGENEESGSLKLDIKPTNADVFVDGYYSGVVDDYNGLFQGLDVAPGGHTITVWCKGYRTVTQQVYVQRDSTLKLSYQMEPLAAGEPQDARPVPPPQPQTTVVSSEEPPPPDQPERPARPRQPRRPGTPAQPPSPPVAAEPPQPGQPPQVRAIGDAPNYAPLAIRVQPVGAQIFIDGEAWQTSPETDRLVVHLPVGPHQLEIRKDGFKTFKTEVQIRVGETTTLNVSLSGQDGQ